MLANGSQAGFPILDNRESLGRSFSRLRPEDVQALDSSRLTGTEKISGRVIRMLSRPVLHSSAERAITSITCVLRFGNVCDIIPGHLFSEERKGL
jgi:hypothetical protein